MKLLGCSAILFAYICWRVLPTFLITRYAFPGCLWGLIRLFLPGNFVRKAGIEVWGPLQIYRVFDSGQKPIHRIRGRTYLCISVIYALFNLYCLYIVCFHAKSFVCMGTETQMNIATHWHAFQRTIRDWRILAHNLIESSYQRPTI